MLSTPLPIVTEAAERDPDVHDVLLLTQLAAGVSVAVLGRPQPDGSWTAEWSGRPSRPTVPTELFDLAAVRPGPVTLADTVAASSGAAGPSVGVSWAYGVAIRDDQGIAVGVLVLLDSWVRSLSAREDRALKHGACRLKMLLTMPRSTRVQPVVRHVDQPAPIMAKAAIDRARRTDPTLLRSKDVARLFDVTERTVINWAASEKLPSLRTLGGQLRFRASDVEALLSES